MTTYKQFLIEANLRCYLDQSGKLTPMFIHTEFLTMQEAEARIDKYWEEWAEFESRRNVNLGRSFEVFIDKKDIPDDDREEEEERLKDKIDEYYELQNMNQ